MSSEQREIADGTLVVRSLENNGSRVIAFAGELDYPNDIGPGVYDIHSPRVPSVEEIEHLLELAESRIGRERLWVNPDCGLKTRTYEQVEAALTNVVTATRRLREVLATSDRP